MEVYRNPNVVDRTIGHSLPYGVRRSVDRASELCDRVGDSVAKTGLEKLTQQAEQPRYGALAGLTAGLAAGLIVGLSLTGPLVFMIGIPAIVLAAGPAVIATNLVTKILGEGRLQRAASSLIDELSGPSREKSGRPSLPGPWGTLETQGLLDPAVAIRSPVPRAELTALLDKLAARGIQFMAHSPGSLTEKYRTLSSPEVVERIKGSEIEPIYLNNAALGAHQEMSALVTLNELRQAEALHGDVGAAGGDPVLTTLRSLSDRGFKFQSQDGLTELDPMAAYLRFTSGSSATMAGDTVQVNIHCPDDLMAAAHLHAGGPVSGVASPELMTALRDFDRMGTRTEPHDKPLARTCFDRYKQLRDKPDEALWLKREGLIFPLSGRSKFSSQATLEAAKRVDAEVAPALAARLRLPKEQVCRDLLRHAARHLPSLDLATASHCLAALVPGGGRDLPGQLDQAASRLSSMTPEALSAYHGLVELLPGPQAAEGAEVVFSPVAGESLADRTELYLASSLGMLEGDYASLSARAFVQEEPGLMDRVRDGVARRRLEARKARVLGGPALGLTGVRESVQTVSLGGVTLSKRRTRT